MSGATIAYHLRPNKAIERQLFVELLTRLEDGLPQKLQDYSYYGFGGAYMEDFRLSQRHLGLTRMFSIEEIPNAIARQRFNRPANCIRFKKLNSKKFVETFNSDTPTIVWLDYTRPSWREQFVEVETLARALPQNSILKITLAANPSALGNPPPGENIDQHVFRLDAIQAMFGELVPNDAKADDLKTKDFPRLLARIFRASVSQVFGALSAKECRPLALYTYSDSTPMLTVTMLVGKKTSNRKTFENSRLKDWKFTSDDWDDLVSINTPDLTLKERIFIESLLPKCDAAKIQKRLGYHIADNAPASLEALKNYIEFHRQLPFFLKVTS